MDLFSSKILWKIYEWFVSNKWHPCVYGFIPMAEKVTKITIPAINLNEENEKILMDINKKNIFHNNNRKHFFGTNFIRANFC